MSHQDTESTTGTTTDSWVKIITKSKQMTASGSIKNTGSTNSLTCKLSCIYAANDTESDVIALAETVAEFTVAPSATKRLRLNIPHHELYVNVKSDSAGLSTTYDANFTLMIAK